MKEVHSVIRCKPWRQADAPNRILVIRFQALGDLMITLPYLQSLRQSLPAVQLHLLTRSEVSAIPENLPLFNKVIRIGGGRQAKLQFILATCLLPYLWFQRYGVVLDLQNHRISRWIRHLLFPSSWSEFDRSSKISAGERTRLTIQALHVGNIRIVPVSLPPQKAVRRFLLEQGWDGNSPFVILNPAGAFVTRNWPLVNYVAFARNWRERYPETFFVMIGTEVMADKAAFLCVTLKDRVIDLTGKTKPFEAFAIVSQAKLLLTEDSGLMHMAWVQGVPTLALFGSSPAYWSAPSGEWTKCLSSSDLHCGNCFSETCYFKDVHCLTRYSPEFVAEEARALLAKPIKELNR